MVSIRDDSKKLSILAKTRPYLALFVAECLGTMVLMFVGCGSTISFDGDPAVSHHISALGFGFAVHLAIQCFGHVSCAHINPAVSIVSLLLGFLNIITFILYIIAQHIGAVLGVGLLKLLFPAHYTGDDFCVTRVTGVTMIQAFFIEIAITTCLCLVICAAWDPRNEHRTDSLPIRFALVISVLCIIAGPITGASMNTARTFGAAVFTADWSDQWIYWIAPNLAAFIAVGIHKLALSEVKNKVDKKQIVEDATVSA